MEVEKTITKYIQAAGLIGLECGPQTFSRSYVASALEAQKKVDIDFAKMAVVTITVDILAGLRAIVDRADNGELGSSKVQDMRRIAADLLAKHGGVNTSRTDQETLEKGCQDDPKDDPENQNIGDQRAVGHGMAIAAAIIMRVWGHSTEATEILNAAGYTSLQKLLDDGVDDYDIDALKPLFEDPFSAEETLHG